MTSSAFFIAVIVLAGFYLLLSLGTRLAYRVPRRREQGTPGDRGLPYRTVTITTANNKELFAWFIPPAETGAHAPAVLVMHGWGSNAEMMLPFARQLYHAGFAVLLLDARNHGQSEGDTFSSMPRFAEDMEHGFDWLASQPEVDPARIALLGHSVGAAASLLLASRRREVAAVVSIAAFSHPEIVMRRQMEANHIPYRLIGWVVLNYIERTIGFHFDDIAPVTTIAKIPCPVLLVHGDDDRTVPHADAEAIFASARGSQVELLTIKGADHDSIEQIDRHGGALVDFLKRIMN